MPKKKKPFEPNKKPGFPGAGVPAEDVKQEPLDAQAGRPAAYPPVKEKDDTSAPPPQTEEKAVLDPEEDPNVVDAATEKEPGELTQEEEDAQTELNEEIDANFQLAWDAEKDWIDEALEDIEFKAGNQWSEEDKLILSNQKRPCLTFNEIKATLRLITGHFIQNSARISVAPQGGEDKKFSDMADRIINHIDRTSQLEFNLGYAFTGGQTTGRAHIELELDYENDPIFGELRSIYHGRPGVILMDPRGTAYDLNQDREFGFKLVKKTKSQLRSLYPNKEACIDELSSDTENPSIAAGQEGDHDNYGAAKHSTTVGLIKSKPKALDNPETAQFHVKEYWRFKRVTKWYVYFVQGGDKPEFDSKAEADAEIEKRHAAFLAEGGREELWKVVVRERKRREMWVAIRCGGEILADGKSPFEPNYTGFPFFQDLADWTPEAKTMKSQIQGMVRCMKDPQREVNKARSQFLHIVNTAANSGWIIDDDSMDQAKKDQLKTFGATPGVIVEKKTNSTVQRIEPVGAPVAQAVREKAAEDSFKKVTGVNSDLLAIDSNANPSGKAMAIRVKQGLTILEPDFRNFRYTKKLIGQAIMKMVPSLFDVAELAKVLGSDYMKTESIDDVDLKSFLIQIEDMKYNVDIAEQGDTKTLREETFEDMMQMVSHGTQLPFEVLAEFMQIPNKDEMIQKVNQYQQKQLALAQASGGQAPGGPGTRR